MKTIFKYELEITDVQDIEVPTGATFIAAQMQRSVLCAWAIVNPDNQKTKRRIQIFGTGHDVSAKAKDGRALKHIGTVQTHREHFVWHVFDGGDVR